MPSTVCAVLNPITASEVSLGIEKLLIANYPRTWSPARVDFDNLPNGFTNVGAVVEDSPVMRYRRTLFTLPLSVLENLESYAEVNGFSAEFEIKLYSNGYSKLQYALANVAPSGANNVLTYGTHENKFYTILGVTDFIDGSQVVHYLPKVTSITELDEMYRPTEASQIPIKFKAFPEEIELNDYTQSYVGYRYSFAAP